MYDYVTTFLPVAWGGQKKGADPVELCVCWESKEVLLPLRHHPSSSDKHFLTCVQ